LKRRVTRMIDAVAASSGNTWCRWRWANRKHCDDVSDGLA